ncbi:MAG: nucleotidyltransferase domain-containing protein [Bdellovibrionaceae bacterium]|jgi:uncharacterized protein|nr:nucleotidyltransferase domain-containing protein [Pseudobdellovibrionaceae bacterium]
MNAKQLGLRDEDLSCIIKTLSKDPSVESIIVFGSRAMGNFKPGSDIDISIKSSSANISKVITRAKDILENESTIPFFFDIVHYESIDNKDLIKHIDQHGLEIYKKK